MKNSRWTYDPILVNGKPKVAVITERDVEQIFSALNRYRFLSTPDIHALVGGDLTALRDRLELLTRAPNRYLNRPRQQQRNPKPQNRPLIYELSDRGIKELKKHDIPSLRKPSTPFAHELMTCRIAASIEIALKGDPSIFYKPFELQPIPVRMNGTKRTIVSDWHPFALGRQGTRKFYFGDETDTGSEQGENSDDDASSVGKKFEEYLQIIEDRAFNDVFRVKTFYIPFVTFSERRQRNLMKLLAKITKGKGSEFILFKHIPRFYDFEDPTPATGHIVTEPWRRVGFPDFEMLQ